MNIQRILDDVYVLLSEMFVFGIPTISMMLFYVCLFFHGMKTPLGLCKGEGDEEKIMLNYSLNGLEGNQGNY